MQHTKQWKYQYKKYTVPPDDVISDETRREEPRTYATVPNVGHFGYWRRTGLRFCHFLHALLQVLTM